MRVAITCLQLIRDIDDVRAAMDEAGFELRVPEIRGQHLEGDALVAALERCIGVAAGDDRFTADVLARLPELRAISKWGVGVDGIDCEAAAARGVTVTNTPGMFDDEVADVAMGLHDHASAPAVRGKRRRETRAMAETCRALGQRLADGDCRAGRYRKGAGVPCSCRRHERCGL